MRTKVAVSSVIDGGRKLVEVEVEASSPICIVKFNITFGFKQF